MFLLRRSVNRNVIADSQFIHIVLYNDIVGIVFFLVVSQGSCLSGWYHIEKFCFRFVPFHGNERLSERMLNTAREKCLKTGADLAAPHTHSIFKRLWTVSQGQSWTHQRFLLLGAHDSLHVDWKWSDGSPVNSAVWGPGEPNTTYGKCGGIADLSRDASTFRSWSAVCGWWLATTRCDQLNGFICETLPGNN